MMLFFFFFNDTATTEIYTLSLHDALPISKGGWKRSSTSRRWSPTSPPSPSPTRSEEHTSELQSQSNLVCRLLLEKKKKKTKNPSFTFKDRQPRCTEHHRIESAPAESTDAA